jgi:hypothetical protein
MFFSRSAERRWGWKVCCAIQIFIICLKIFLDVAAVQQFQNINLTIGTNEKGRPNRTALFAGFD